MFLLTTLFILFLSAPAAADSVVLMLADGMGFNHMACAEKEKPLFLSALPVSGEIRTYSANSAVTDSAASATAYACGIKTNNGYVGVNPENIPCETTAERAVKNDYFTALLTTDTDDGATPAAFYAHVASRHAKDDIQAQRLNAVKNMVVRGDIENLPATAADIVEQAEMTGFPYFILIEEGDTDKQSHGQNPAGALRALHNFDAAVKAVVELVSPDTTVIVLSDHETGGLNAQDCQFTTTEHTDANIPLFATGKHARSFSGELNNTQINHKINRILFTTP